MSSSVGKQMTKVIIAICALLFSQGFLISSVLGVECQKIGPRLKLIASTNYSTNNKDHILSLWRQEHVPLSSQEERDFKDMLRKEGKDIRKFESTVMKFGNIAYLLTDADVSDPGSCQLVWVGYVVEENLDSVNSDILWNKFADTAYVIMLVAEKEASRSRIALYEAKIQKIEAQIPFEFDLRNVDKLPSPPTAISELSELMYLEFHGAIQRIPVTSLAFMLLGACKSSSYQVIEVAAAVTPFIFSMIYRLKNGQKWNCSKSVKNNFELFSIG
jgi:hypothetical protein